MGEILNAQTCQTEYEKAQKLLEQGELAQGCRLLMGLYNKGFQQETIYLWLVEQAIMPNLDTLEGIYQENRQQLSELYPQYFLPDRELLDYQLFPISEDFYGLFDANQHSFILDELDETQNFYLGLLAGSIDGELEPDEEEILGKIAGGYRAKSANLYTILDAMILRGSLLSPAILEQIDLCHKYNPYDERYLLLYASYYLQTQNDTLAESYLKQFQQTNYHNLIGDTLLVTLYQRQGRKLEEAKLISHMIQMESLVWGWEKLSVLDKYRERLKELQKELPEDGKLEVLFPYISCYGFYPAKLRVFWDPSQGSDCAFGEYVFPHELKPNTWNPFIGMGKVANMGLALDNWILLHEGGFHEGLIHNNHNAWTTMKLEFRQAMTFRQLTLPKPEEPMAYSILATNVAQKIHIRTKGKEYDTEFPAYQFRDFRQESKMEIWSEEPFLIGKPTVLKHSPKRKKLVLNLFIDAGSYRFIQEDGFSCCPNIRAFFEKGCIFANNFSPGEYTWYCYPSLMTGNYAHQHQFYLDREYTELSEHLLTMTDRFSQEGYSCAAVSATATGVSSKILRNFDRITFQSAYNYTFQDIVADTIDQLEAFQESDLFVWTYTLELHKIFNESLCPMSLRVRQPFEEIYGEGVEKDVASVQQKYSQKKCLHYQARWQEVDTYLGLLFQYIERHYAPEDYVVTLFSDHGVTAVDTDDFILKPNHTQTCFMVRGAGVPERGLVTDEVTNGVDLYPTVCHLAGVPYDPEKIAGVVPKALGGPGRKYSITESLFPGQVYRICIRDLDYELRLITDSIVQYDGYIHLEPFKATLLDRHTMEPVDKPEVMKEFMREAYRHTNCLRSCTPVNTNSSDHTDTMKSACNGLTSGVAAL